ncbi:hypothetical protein DICPUDRAFT_92044 [Dictyostelium purpureum]|uniref:Uncharacterized protein n=1 Tax=Dictyostelium purpureum TaxID=5786 RepID=F0ZL28_DICPU|nr:uncharacterized protein DICPUDRAFT_92044 [Dictyostelium purpureum]EGC35367.1 hypothetical protein DICPUDRAFT_92044 [Dictyostelium purpureum]|eukprot:XP_003288105.1 hypothetical protein DICPUDRAFT_92044 [Dictyostelium purpureum]
MIGKLFKAVTPETYILIFNASLVSLYGINVGVQQLLNLRETQEDGPQHTSVGDHFKARGSQLANGKSSLLNFTN